MSKSSTARVLPDLTQQPATKAKTAAKPAITLADGFDASDIRCLMVKDGTSQVWCYTNEYKGKSYFHIRQVYQTDDGAWHPGKGVSMPDEKKDSFLANLLAK